MSKSSINVDYLSNEKIKEILDKTIKKYSIQIVIPVDIEFLVEVIFKLPIETYNNLPESGIAYLKNNLSGIIVKSKFFNEKRFENPLRFALAHELGHYILHKNIYEKIEYNSEKDFIYTIENISEIIYKRCEYQANEFAGNLLVPKKELLEIYFNEISSEKMKNKLKNNFLEAELDLSINLSKRFIVSDQVIRKRLRNENIINLNEL